MKRVNSVLFGTVCCLLLLFSGFLQVVEAATTSIVISSSGFSAVALTINVGDKVKWSNEDIVSHHIYVEDSEGAVVKQDELVAKADGLPEGDYSYTPQFNVAGNYLFYVDSDKANGGSLTVMSPSPTPTVSPTLSTSATPTVSPTVEPTLMPTSVPSTTPEVSASVEPTPSMTVTPTVMPTAEPSATVTVTPTATPTVTMSPEPTSSPDTEVLEFVQPGVTVLRHKVCRASYNDDHTEINTDMFKLNQIKQGSWKVDDLNVEPNAVSADLRLVSIKTFKLAKLLLGLPDGIKISEENEVLNLDAVSQQQLLINLSADWCTQY